MTARAATAAAALGGGPADALHLRSHTPCPPAASQAAPAPAAWHAHGGDSVNSVGQGTSVMMQNDMPRFSTNLVSTCHSGLARPYHRLHMSADLPCTPPFHPPASCLPAPAAPGKPPCPHGSSCSAQAGSSTSCLSQYERADHTTWCKTSLLFQEEAHRPTGEVGACLARRLLLRRLLPCPAC